MDRRGFLTAALAVPMAAAIPKIEPGESLTESALVNVRQSAEFATVPLGQFYDYSAGIHVFHNDGVFTDAGTKIAPSNFARILGPQLKKAYLDADG